MRMGNCRKVLREKEFWWSGKVKLILLKEEGMRPLYKLLGIFLLEGVLADSPMLKLEKGLELMMLQILRKKE